MSFVMKGVGIETRSYFNFTVLGLKNSQEMYYA